MNENTHSSKQIFIGLAVAYFTGMIVVGLVASVPRANELEAATSGASTIYLEEKCSQTGARNLEICHNLTWDR